MKKPTEVLTIEPTANITAIMCIFYGSFTLLAIFCFVNPFFKHLFSFASVIITLLLGFVCLSASRDKERGVVRTKPKQKNPFPKWLGHTFFILMIFVSAGLKLGFYSIAVCWVVSWLAFYSTKTHVVATYKKEE